MEKNRGFEPLSPSGIRRDDRAAEGARLEVVCTRKGTEGSNPSLSESLFVSEKIKLINKFKD